ncbi:hypothetical protein QKC54_gp0451 [Megavirus baoshan]|uniref:Uncharacterized protein n=1 Tax=Megavirus baoshan TaxID=2496520 RepID=A0A3S8UXE6_9VIRU|nr:hypothetical protein QKC54_gp0451 [Megavirus baoshan]AZL89377.1 hypothetical protein Mb0621 [Megavirus baoshan]
MRNFTLIDPVTKKTNGKYYGHTPKQAATKAYSQYVRKLIKENKPVPQVSIIILQERKFNGYIKNYSYEASRKNYIQPITRFINNKTIIFSYYNVLHKIKNPQVNNKMIENNAKIVDIKNSPIPQIYEIVI